MRTGRNSFLGMITMLAVGVLFLRHAAAISRDYTIDPAQSSITISGTVFSADLNQTKNIVEQSAGSLTTSYTGAIKSNRELSTFTLVGGSNVDASVKGNYQPLA